MAHILKPIRLSQKGTTMGPSGRLWFSVFSRSSKLSFTCIGSFTGFSRFLRVPRVKNLYTMTIRLTAAVTVNKRCRHVGSWNVYHKGYWKSSGFRGLGFRD